MNVEIQKCLCAIVIWLFKDLLENYAYNLASYSGECSWFLNSITKSFSYMSCSFFLYWRISPFMIFTLDAALTITVATTTFWTEWTSCPRKSTRPLPPHLPLPLLRQWANVAEGVWDPPQPRGEQLCPRVAAAGVITLVQGDARATTASGRRLKPRWCATTAKVGEWSAWLTLT